MVWRLENARCEFEKESTWERESISTMKRDCIVKKSSYRYEAPSLIEFFLMEAVKTIPTIPKKQIFADADRSRKKCHVSPSTF